MGTSHTPAARLPAQPSIDGRGLPMRVLLTPGQAGDNPQLLPLLDGIRVARIGAGRPPTRPDGVIADKAYSHDSTRAALRSRRIRCTGPERADQTAHRAAQGRAGGRPPAFDRHIYKRRNFVEHCSTDSNQSELILAAIALWLR
ncbi:hypothetical protein GCM10009539_59760 [Cryptosporangium japonicum]|uniref:Transposase IS4-like domain-containing protein n=1 Tax=Cryptosporangium japonicum TaxID=80872 RepID=A0ABN0UXW8_9ACTN